MSPKINHPNIGDVQKTAYLEGTILEVYPSDEEDFIGEPEESRIDTVDINIVLDDGNISGLTIPLFYHCASDSVLRANGALEGASAAFSVDDEVIVQCEIISANHYKPLRVMGFMDKPKACGWIEDWEGETIVSNHLWTDLETASCSDLCCSETPDEVSVVTFDGSKVLKTHVCFPEHPIPGEWGGWCCVWPWVDFDTSPEERINLSKLSGFKSRIYIDDLYPSSQPSSGRGHCTYLIWIKFGVHCISLNTWSYYLYGFHCIDDFDDSDESSGLSYSELKAKCGSWHNTEQITDFNPLWGYFYNVSASSPPWGDSNYEIGGIEIYSYVTNMQEYGDSFKNVKSRIIAYFDDLIFY